MTGALESFVSDPWDVVHVEEDDPDLKYSVRSTELSSKVYTLVGH